MSEKINGKAFYTLLKRAHLRGTLEECVVEIKNGIGTIQAVDMSNSIFLSCSEPLPGIPDTTLGLGKLSLITAFLDDSDDIQYSVDTKEGEGIWLTLKRGRGQIKTLLIDSALVPTVVQGDPEEIKDNMLKMTPISYALSKKEAEEICEYIAMLGCSGVQFSIKEGALCVSSSESEKMFHLTLSTGIPGDIAVEVFSQYLVTILKSLEWSENETPHIFLGNGAPVIFKQNESNLWALTPVVS